MVDTAAGESAGVCVPQDLPYNALVRAMLVHLRNQDAHLGRDIRQLAIEPLKKGWPHR